MARCTDSNNHLTLYNNPYIIIIEQEAAAGAHMQRPGRPARAGKPDTGGFYCRKGHNMNEDKIIEQVAADITPADQRPQDQQETMTPRERALTEVLQEVRDELRALKKVNEDLKTVNEKLILKQKVEQRPTDNDLFGVFDRHKY